MPARRGGPDPPQQSGEGLQAVGRPALVFWRDGCTDILRVLANPTFGIGGTELPETVSALLQRSERVTVNPGP